MIGNMKVIDEERVCVMEGDWSPVNVIRKIVEDGVQEHPFYVMDLGEVVERYRQWRELMPRVEPFYAVKCNDDKLLVRTLAALGAGFDCASKAEIQLVMDMGVKAERIIFANPAKMSSHIRYATARGVDTMTFDSEIELHKIKQCSPDAQLVIRIRCDAAAAQCPLGIKFGCDPLTEAPKLLKLAAVLKLNVVGVSFHAGSGAGETLVYARGIKMARVLFDLGDTLGLKDMKLVDIGGGFAGNTDSDLSDVAQVVNAAIETNFNGRDVRVIAEPGRYFAAAAYTLAAMVHATRVVSNNGEPHTMYFINDGVYGSFNCVLYDHQTVRAETLQPIQGPPEACSIWGPTCDGLDCVVASCRLPAQRAGDWLVFKDMGAYTLPVASAFNGFPVPRVRALVDKRLWAVLKDLWPLNEGNFMLDSHPTGPQTPDSMTPSDRSLTPSPILDTHQTVFVECALK